MWTRKLHHREGPHFVKKREWGMKILAGDRVHLYNNEQNFLGESEEGC